MIFFHVFNKKKKYTQRSQNMCFTAVAVNKNTHLFLLEVDLIQSTKNIKTWMHKYLCFCSTTSSGSDSQLFKGSRNIICTHLEPEKSEDFWFWNYDLFEAWLFPKTTKYLKAFFAFLDTSSELLNAYKVIAKEYTYMLNHRI